ncbi:hypothetical protein PpBr36_01988 [Pyricularia pennisetigena]|uniref:hypothetical protein n=1 Tax=Pyricularia pennisetigena TaxID=1578925 RepID=UPI0011536069|nr:hypothetical protein PpBr36_01988 [Pyricularia pennisetigena]TLS28137.1 hypothetical protein PpBr36_01988 [Pyricularia pennisetigena]
MFSLSILNVFIAQLWLALLTHAAPIAEETLTATGHGNAWQYGTGGGILGLIVLILDVIAFIEILGSNREPSGKLLWCLVVFLFPIVGMVIYYLFSNRASHGSSGYEPVA